MFDAGHFKCANPTLKIVAKRNIQQMKARLEALQELLEERQRLLCRPWRNPPLLTTPLTESFLRSNRLFLIQ